MNPRPARESVLIPTRWLSCVVILLVGIRLCSSAATVQTNTAAKLAVSERAWDFGTVAAGEVVYHEFLLTNISQSPLQIADVRLGCGCLRVSNWSKTITPGEVGKLPVWMLTETLGRTNFAKTVTVTFRDSSPLEFALKGTVYRMFHINPNTVWFVGLQTGSNQVRNIHVTVLSKEPREILSAEPTHPKILAKLSEIKPGREYNVAVSLEPGTNEQVIGELILKTSDARVPQLKARVWSQGTAKKRPPASKPSSDPEQTQ